MRTMVGSVLVLVVAAAGCKKKEPAATGGGSAAPTAPGGTAPAPAVDAAAPAVDAKVDPTAGLPAFGKAAGADPEKAKDLVSQARSALDGGDGDALELAIAAVKADPGSPHARVVLAGAVEDDAIALAQLTPLTTATAADCPGCADAVRNLQWSPSDAVKALAAKVTPSPQRAATETLFTFLEDGDAAKVTKYFTAKKVLYSVACSVCDGSEGDTIKKLTGAKLLAELEKQVRQAIEGQSGEFVTGDALTCADNCCSVDRTSLQHNHMFFDAVCFIPNTDQIVKLDFTSGG